MREEDFVAELDAHMKYQLKVCCILTMIMYMASEYSAYALMLCFQNMSSRLKLLVL